jgi:hypothetical protein
LGGDARQAIAFYRSFLRHQPAASNRREIEARIGTLEKQLASHAPPSTPVTSEPPPSRGKKPDDAHVPHQTPPIFPKPAPRTQPPTDATPTPP